MREGAGIIVGDTFYMYSKQGMPFVFQAQHKGRPTKPKMAFSSLRGGGGGETQTNAQAAIITGSTTTATNHYYPRQQHQQQHRQRKDDDEEEKDVVGWHSPFSGTPLIIDWRRRRHCDESIEETVRVGALNLVASKAPGSFGCCQEENTTISSSSSTTTRWSPTFVENGPAQTYKYIGSPVTSPTIIPLGSPWKQQRHYWDEEMATADSPTSDAFCNLGKKIKNSNRHVTFSDPEISHVLITHDEPILTDDQSRCTPVATVDRPLTIRRTYLAEASVLDVLRRSKSYRCLDMSEGWSEMYYDTPASSLSSLECILMKDTRAEKYWKFFSFAEENIMEITTDEKEISEPLSRLVPQQTNGPTTNGDDRSKTSSVDHRRRIDSDSLKPFFAIRHETDSFVNWDDGTYLKATVTDYGFAWVVVERLCIDGQRLAHITEEIEKLAKDLGLSNLANYDPMRYL